MITNRVLSLTSRAVRTPITVRALSTQKKAPALKLNSQKKTNEIFQKMKQEHLNQSSNQIKQRQSDQSIPESFYFEQAKGMLIAKLPDEKKDQALNFKTADDIKNYLKALEQEKVQLTPPQDVGSIGANQKQPDLSSQALQDYNKESVNKIHDALKKIQEEENTTVNTKN